MVKEELQSKLVEILASIQTAAGKAGDFAMEQLPDLAQSYVAYGRAYSAVWLACSVALIALALVCFARAKKDDHGTWHFKSGFADFGGGYFMAAAFAGVGIINAILASKSALLVWFAPKVWLLKEIASLLK